MSLFVKTYEALENFGPQIVGVVSGGKTSISEKKRRRYRYKSVHNGRVLRKHYTKKTALAYAKKFGYGAKVLSISEPVVKKTPAKKRTSYSRAPRVIYVEKRKPSYKRFYKKRRRD